MSKIPAKKPIAVVRYLDKKQPYATVHGDSIALYMQGGYYFDHEGYVVSAADSALPRDVAIASHGKHKALQEDARTEAREKAATASSKLNTLLGETPEEIVEPVMPATGWDEISVTNLFPDRQADVLKLKGMPQKAVAGFCKKLGIEFDANMSPLAKWSNIYNLMVATQPDEELAESSLKDELE